MPPEPSPSPLLAPRLPPFILVLRFVLPALHLPLSLSDPEHPPRHDQSSAVLSDSTLVLGKRVSQAKDQAPGLLPGLQQLL